MQFCKKKIPLASRHGYVTDFVRKIFQESRWNSVGSSAHALSLALLKNALSSPYLPQILQFGKSIEFLEDDHSPENKSIIRPSRVCSRMYDNFRPRHLSQECASKAPQ